MMNEQDIDISTSEVSGGDVSGGDSVPQAVGYDVVYSAVYDATTDALAAQQTVTDGQNINSSALTFFEGILGNQRIPKDYVVYVGEPYTYNNGSYDRTAYEYCMVMGELENDGTSFTGTGDIYTLRLSGDVGCDIDQGQTISLDAPLYYSRSNLGYYSGIIDYDWSEFLVPIMLALGGVIWFVKKLMRLNY